MGAKLLSLYLLTVAGLAIVRAAPLILDQRQDNPNDTLPQAPSNQLGPVYNITNSTSNATSVPFKRAVLPLILGQRQDNPTATAPQSSQQSSCATATSPNNPNASFDITPRSQPTMILGQRQDNQSSCATATATSPNNPNASFGISPRSQQPTTPLILDQRQQPPITTAPTPSPTVPLPNNVTSVNATSSSASDSAATGVAVN